MGGAYEFIRNGSANLREKNDSWNPTIGGFFAGAILGLRCELSGNRPVRSPTDALIVVQFAPYSRC